MIKLHLATIATILSAMALAPAAYAAGTFSPTGSLNTGRRSHTATLLPNGKVLVAGGFIPRQDSTGIPQASAELYDPATGTWTPTGSLTTARAGHTATLLPNGKVLAVSGIYGGGGSAELYDPATGAWTPTGSLNTARNGYHTATLLPNGKVLIAAGLHSVFADAALKSAELYEPTTGAWTPTGSLREGRTDHTATLLPNGKVLVAGGDQACCGVPTASAELYDPATGTWTVTGNLNTGRARHSATLLPSGQVLLAGGLAEINFNFIRLSSTELYNPATGTWTPTGSLNTVRISAMGTLLPNGKVLVGGGYASNNDGTTVAELYNPATGMWTPTGSLNTARPGHTATLLPNGKVLFAAGRTSGSPTFTSAELFSESDILPFSPDPGPVTAPQRLPDGKLQFSHTNVSGLPFTAVGTTDLSTPAANWTFIGVGIETAPGQYQFTDPAATNYPRRFYQVRLP